MKLKDKVAALDCLNSVQSSAKDAQNMALNHNKVHHGKI